MKGKFVDDIINEVNNRSDLKSVNNTTFWKLLQSAKVPKNTSKFYSQLPLNRQLLNEGFSDTYFFFERVLMPENIKDDYKINLVKKLYASWNSFCNRYSTSVITRELQTDEKLMDMIKNSEDSSYSILGKMRIQDYRDSTTVYTVKPILIIPGASDLDYIKRWEKSKQIISTDGSIESDISFNFAKD